MKRGKRILSSSSEPESITALSTYEVRVRGCMDRKFWSDWFGEMDISVNLKQGETILRGHLTDQAELYGLLSRLRNLGLALISLEPVPEPKKGNGESS